MADEPVTERVYKFTFDTPTCEGRCEIWMPKGSRSLSVGQQFGDLVVWAAVAVGEESKEAHHFIVTNTGADLPVADVAHFLGTVQVPTAPGAQIVWHIFEVK